MVSSAETTKKISVYSGQKVSDAGELEDRNSATVGNKSWRTARLYPPEYLQKRQTSLY